MQSQPIRHALYRVVPKLGDASTRFPAHGLMRLAPWTPALLAPPDGDTLRQLVAGIAHDYNNLLTAIICGTALAKGDLAPDHPARATLDIAANAGEQAAALTRQLMAYAGISPFVGSRVDLSELIRKVAASFRARIARRVRLRTDLPAGLPPVWADTSQIEQLVGALIANAVEAIPEGTAGIVSIGARPARIDGERKYVHLTVGDTGCGMDNRVRRKIFEPFFSTKLVGRGMGLAAVAGIVRAHCGVIQVRSAHGAGSVFSVYLPAAPLATPRSECSGSGKDPDYR
jgi:two-component system, cell cycle sensor histidine kinase and response regulator CckA